MKLLLYYLVLLIVILSNFDAISAARKKCTRTINRIPVHKDFNLKKFVGTWYTIKRTEWVYGKGTYHSFSIAISQHEDNTFHYSFTGKDDSTCLPVVSGVLKQRARAGSYFMSGSGPDDERPTLIVSFTDYKNMALVYYCFNYRPGSQRQCHKDGMQVEIITKSLTPKQSDAAGYVKRATKRLCAPIKQLKSTEPGHCKIPDILEAARIRNQKSKSEDIKAAGTNKCAVNKIPVQENFNSSQLHGLWYEIARTRFTFNKMESVVNFHRYDDVSGKIYSYYTGTIVIPPQDDGSEQYSEVPCLAAIHGMSIVKENAEYDSDRMGRIGWDDETSLPWASLKILYADEDYILFYSCFGGAVEEQCVESMMEVTLSGRTREITEERKASIFGVLNEICVDVKDVIDTQFYANCTDWVLIEEDKVEPDEVNFDDIPNYEDYDKDQIKGRWFHYASISYNSTTSLKGVVMDTNLTGDIIQSNIYAFDEDGNCTTYHSVARDLCYDSSDEIMILPKGGDGNFVFNKILYLDDVLLVTYTCTLRTLEGTCNKTGISFNVYTRNFTIDELNVNEETVTNTITKLAESAHLDSGDLVTTTNWCPPKVEEVEQALLNGKCDIDKIGTVVDADDADEYIQELLYGYWYEIARSRGHKFMTEKNKTDERALIAYFTSTNNETLNVYYTELSDEGDEVQCSNVSHVTLLSRCRTDCSGDYLARFNETVNFVSYVPYKVIYTDYASVLVTYTCQEMAENGECTASGIQFRVWARNYTLDDSALAYAYATCDWACMDPFEGYFQENINRWEALECEDCQKPCTSKLEEYVIDNNLDYVMEHDDDNDDDEHNEPKDQRHRDQFQLDLEAALLMDDDEFYSYDEIEDMYSEPLFTEDSEKDAE